jgi:serine phosphatase RsbU (regulator of sigma subunit)
MVDDLDVDYAALFEATPTPYLVLGPDLVIRAANRAYLAATSRRREELVGRHVFEAFPANPADAAADGTRNLRRSLERARESGRPDVMAIQRYDIELPGTGEFVERYWSPINVPVQGADGRTRLLLHRVEDVTAFVRERRSRGEATRRMEDLEAELFTRARDLQDANVALRRASDHERRVSLALQRAMLPTPLRSIAGLRVASRYRPAADAISVGGDWFDVVELEAGRVALSVGDVVGKGLPAAGVMGQLRSASNAASYAADGPAEALAALDRFALSVPGALGATVAQVQLGSGAGVLRYSRAGHLPPLLAARDGARFLGEAGGPPLGVLPGTARPHAEVAFPSGATLVLYTDGLVERRNRPIDAGLDRLAQVVSAHFALDAEALADAIIAELLADGAATDDLALLVARGPGSPGK